MSNFTKSYDMPENENIILKPTKNDIIYYDDVYKIIDHITNIDEIHINFEDKFRRYDDIPVLEYNKIEDKYLIFIRYTEYEYNYCIISNSPLKITCNYSHKYFDADDDEYIKNITDYISTVDEYPYCRLYLHRFANEQTVLDVLRVLCVTAAPFPPTEQDECRPASSRAGNNEIDKSSDLIAAGGGIVERWLESAEGGVCSECAGDAKGLQEGTLTLTEITGCKKCDQRAGGRFGGRELAKCLQWLAAKYGLHSEQRLQFRPCDEERLQRERDPEGFDEEERRLVDEADAEAEANKKVFDSLDNT